MRVLSQLARSSRANRCHAASPSSPAKQRERRNHLRLYVKPVVKKPEREYYNASSVNRLRNPQDDSDSKKRPAPRAVANSFRSRDECGDRIVEAENADLADDVSGRPGNRV